MTNSVTIEKSFHSDTTGTVSTNTKHKDVLFRMIFSDKKDLLELYNAVNDTDYQDMDALTITTLEDALYMGYKNDISFLFGEMLSLYEHQSTPNPNMPLRGLLYFARNYQAYIDRNHLDIYSSVLQRIPLPQYIVFYNGTQEMPERKILRLSDAFPKHPGKIPRLSCEASLLNINYGKNKKIMDRCRKLEEYAILIAEIRLWLDKGFPLGAAIDRAVDACIEKHILESFLAKHRAEVRTMVLSTFDQENHDRILKEHSEKIGFNHGKKQGLEQGKLESIIAITKKKLEKQMSVKVIADFMEEPEETIQRIADTIQTHPEADLDALCQLLHPSDEM